MTEEDILEAARIAGEWLCDRRERLELHENEPTALVWLAVREVEAILDAFEALDAVGLLTLGGRVLRDDLSDLIDGDYFELVDS